MDIDAPPDRSYGAEARSNLKAQVRLAPDLYKAEAEYQPKYAELSRQQFSDMLLGKEGGAPGLLEMYRDEIGPAMRDSAREGARSQREGDVSDIETYGQRAVEAIQGANPGQKRLLDMLTGQAGEELALGSSLDPSQVREAEQGMRSARAARGMGYGGGDANLETMARLLKGEKTRAGRRNFAMQVAGLNQATGIDPMLAVTGRPGMVAQPGAFGSPGAGGPSLFNPESAYGQDVWNTNYNAHAAAKIAQGNANAALWGAGIEAAGKLAGAGIAACWVAREVFGEGDNRWRVFKDWLMNDAPRDLRAAYLTWGPAVAEFIKDKPELKDVIRGWMEEKIQNRTWDAEREAVVGI